MVMMRARKCRNCRRPVADDGYGETVHEETGYYGCDPNEVDGDERYPFAS